tara:strand:+ start:533 stop:1291 length:759 start_codon:yes stop_codon:yes gene_type:complete
VPNLRIIPRLDIKGENLIKGVNLEGLRSLGSPKEFAIDYYNAGADEIIYMDCVASLYGRNHLSDLIKSTVANTFIPITVGGGIRSLEDASNLMHSGADKIAINTAAVQNPKLITNIANYYGSQCMVLSVEAKKNGEQSWEVYTENGREKTGMDVIEWVRKAVDLGAGEILLTSVDQEGTRKGFDNDLISSVANTVRVPIISSGGMGEYGHIVSASSSGADAIAIADFLHYRRGTIGEIRSFCKKNGLEVRNY